MTQRMNLLYPEWQGGRCPDVHRGAHWLAEAVFAGRGYVTIDAPAAQPGEVEGVFRRRVGQGGRCHQHPVRRHDHRRLQRYGRIDPVATQGHVVDTAESRFCA